MLTDGNTGHRTKLNIIKYVTPEAGYTLATHLMACHLIEVSEYQYTRKQINNNLQTIEELNLSSF